MDHHYFGIIQGPGYRQVPAVPNFDLKPYIMDETVEMDPILRLALDGVSLSDDEEVE